MIPYEYVLLAYIPFAALLMLDRNSARGFSLAYILALVLLPSTSNPVTDSGLGIISMPAVPDLDKGNVPTIGILLGTILFCPERFDRFRVSSLDFLLLVVMQFHFITSYLNGFGAYDGVSQVMKFSLNFVAIVFLARIHIGTPAGLRMFLLCLTLTAAACAPFAMWEFRFSPQIHTEVYGYFQHVFQQHMRGGFFRPILAFTHGLVLARFFAFTAFLALFPMRGDLDRLLGPVGRYLFVLPLIGLLVSMSLGPYMIFGLLCVGWFVLQRYRWAYFALPVLGFLWLFAFFVDIEIGFGSVHRFLGVSTERAQSLEYRLLALSEYKDTILARPGFGWGGWNSGRTGRATDSFALIEFLTHGLMGGLVFFAWWFGVLTVAHRVKDIAYGTQLGARARAVTLMACIGLVVSVIDSALDTYLVILLSSLVSIYGWLITNPMVPALITQQQRRIGTPSVARAAR
jgi:hypothetical protein